MKNQAVFDYLDSKDFDLLFEPAPPPAQKEEVKQQRPEPQTTEENKTNGEVNSETPKVVPAELEGGESEDEWEKQEEDAPE